MTPADAIPFVGSIYSTPSVVTPAPSPLVRLLARAGRLDLFETAMAYRNLKRQWADAARSRWSRDELPSNREKALLRYIIEIDTMLCRRWGVGGFAKVHHLIIAERHLPMINDILIVDFLAGLTGHSSAVRPNIAHAAASDMRQPVIALQENTSIFEQQRRCVETKIGQQSTIRGGPAIRSVDYLLL